MKKPDPIFGFLLIYFGLIIVSFLGYQIIFDEAIVSSSSFLNLNYAVALSSLIHIDGIAFNENLPVSYLFFSLFISQISGITILSYLLWFYWKLFGTEIEKEAGLRKAFKLTILISFISESLFFLFFLYSIPIELVDSNFQKKLFAALSLAINSFNNAGFPLSSQFFTHGFLEKYYVLQIGIAGGSILGSLGIFVIYELFSPKKLRERLNDSTIDWSFVTKISVYGVILILILFSCILFFIESDNYLKEKNLMESIIASIYEITSARGFGFFLVENVENKFTSAVKLFVSTVGSGPFSTGGGLTLLSLVWVYSLLWKNHEKSMHLLIANSVVKNLIIYSLIAFSIPTLLLFVIDSESTVSNLFINQLQLFNANRLLVTSSSNWYIDLIKSFTIMAGRIGFIVACFITLKQQKNNSSTIK